MSFRLPAAVRNGCIFLAEQDSTEMLRDFALSLSLVNLCFLGLWVDLQKISSPSMDYYRKTPAGWKLAGATLLDELLVAGCFWAAITWIRHTRSLKLMAVSRCVFAGFLVLACEIMRSSAFEFMEQQWLMALLKILLLYLEVLFAVGTVLLAVFQQRLIFRFGVGLVTLLSPLPFIVVAHQVWVHPSASVLADKSPAAPLSGKDLAHVRVACLIFDEMDQYLAFAHRPACIALPEFDRLGGEAITASHTYPAADITLESLPSMILGRRVIEAQTRGASDIWFKYVKDGPYEAWGNRPSIFSRAKDLGFNTSLIGWYHPYGRLLGGIVTHCYWEPNVDVSPLMLEQAYYENVRLTDSMPDQIAKLSNLIPRSWLPGIHRFFSRDREELEFLRQLNREQYLRFSRLALQELSDPSLGLVFVHIPVPHPLGIYDRTRDIISTDPRSNYLDNLELADHTLGEIRRAMERAGTWNSTTLVITSDHPFRPEIWSCRPTWTEEEASLCGAKHPLIPFFVKIAGPSRGGKFEAPINAVLVHDLTLGLLKGELTSSEQVLEWLERHQSVTPAQ